ncbi:MAG: endonuclease/exonuclease/phosphatase family protein [Verrucomicrobia bacterium]|nr:endonuclease/exonuclease/phosphatase family protein [Verrucomicrobiota bacterium]
MKRPARPAAARFLLAAMSLPRLWLALAWCFSASTLGALTLMTYNAGGNASTHWSTNAPQIQAIGRQVMFLQPDIITFNEIPFTNSWQMTNFVKAYLPGYFVARASGTDGYLRSVIVSRFPIAREQKWLDGVLLTEFGYDGRFTRDLFEAEIRVPDYVQPLHVFTTHLKSASDADSAARRAAEASAISNFFVAVFLPAHAGRPYVLTGDLNEDVNRPPSNSRRPIQRLVNSATDLRLTTPLHPVTKDERTFSSRRSLTVRFDYVLPCGLLFSNVVSSQVFRASLLNPPVPPLLKSDEQTGSDHLPVVVEFANPYGTGYGIASMMVAGDAVSMSWGAVVNGIYQVESASDLVNWQVRAAGLTATGDDLSWTAPLGGPFEFFRVVRTR